MDGLGLDVLAVLTAVGLVAGFVDSIAGGGGLLTVPALLWAGLSPAQALATNKLQSSFGSFSAAFRFVVSGDVAPRAILPMVACTFVGACAGALLVQAINPEFLRDVIPGDVDAHRRIGVTAFSVVVGGGVGFYDGVFGPGTGTFFAIAFVSLLGFNLKKATAHTKVLNFTSNIASLLMFLAGGQIVWTVGLAMGAGQYLGAWLGAHMVIRNGPRLVRPLLVAASIGYMLSIRHRL
ncbi:TSUP family transporter, partial [bacterium]|nr:TSUP family transporter [bacterium]